MGNVPWESGFGAFFDLGVFVSEIKFCSGNRVTMWPSSFDSGGICSADV